MGVYINMEMPRNCNECRFAIENYCYAVLKYKHLRGGERKNWCPLIEVPPHGDLIDRNALPWEAMGFMLTDPEEWGLSVSYIDSAPVVIPADSEE